MRSPTERYHAAAHAMQSGVATLMGQKPEEAGASPKHLRVGVNTAHADIGSLARLLIAKGVFTEEEYLAALAEGMEAEAKGYEALLSKLLGTTIKLG